MTSRNKIVTLSLFILLSVLIVLSSFKTIYMKEDNKSIDNNSISFTINGETTNETFPPKESGYVVDEVVCKEGVRATWDNDRWGLINIESDNNRKINCNINFIKAIEVNLDANGGNVNPSTMFLNIEKTFNELPIPVKNGYSFKGWNGKNLFDSSKINNNIKLVENTEVGDEQYFVSDYINIDNTKEYVLSGNDNVFEIFTYDDNNQYLGKIDQNSNVSIRFNDNVTNIRFNALKNNVDKIQLEQNSQSTSYEPFYLDDKVIVKNDSARVLKAIWE